VAQAAGSFGSPAAIDVTFAPLMVLSSINLPSGYAWVTPGTAVGNVGDGKTFAATFTDPSGNYTTASGNITVNVKMKRKPCTYKPV
jgi:hypothetical protein